MTMHTCQIDFTDIASLTRDHLTGPVLAQGGMLWGRQQFCRLDPWLWCYRTISDIDDQPGWSPSIAGLPVENTEGGRMTRSSIKCWVVAAISRI